MERRGLDGPVVPSNSVDGGTGRTSAHRLQQPDYSEKSVQEALEHLASIDLIELPIEAKVEHCRATRDLRSCGRSVECVLNSCGHASLCAECSRRCDICPICRIPIPKKGNIFRLRLYYECVAAHLISKGDDDRFQEKQNGKNQLIADVQRLYSLFDVAIDNNLVSLICHYVTDVCMDESAVSSDPLIAFLLDEVVVKDWCKRTFKNIITELQGIYKLALQEMKTMLGSLLKSSVKLVGLSNVLEVLESSFRDTLSVQLHDLHDLQDNILKTKQHIEMMIWCLRHQFLENVRSRHTNITSWRSHVRERKSAAIKHSWPDSVNHSADSMRRDGSTLFIEDALSNLEIEQGYSHETAGELEIASLQKDGGSSFFRSTIEGMAGCYPFENLRAATDMLFWHGSSDLVVAKQAIFLYYLFDRHWTIPDEEWRYVVDDFAATFSISRHSLLESFTFYLLDDHTNEALQEACRLLPEISGPTTHPKVAQVLLERQNPDAALMVLRWSGRDGGSQLVSLGEAITTVRVRVECGLLTEAFMYQRMLCTKVKERKLMHESRDASDDLKDERRTWVDWVEALVTEICCLCIRRNLVDRMIELPWNLDEEKYLHKSLLDFAIDDPSTTIGSLLVVFYLQRYRYIEAYQVDRKLQNVEQDFISKNSVSEEVLIRMESASHWRTGLVAKSIKLLPEVQQQQVKTGKLPELVFPALEVDIPANSDIPEVQEPNSTSLLVPSSIDSSIPNQMDKATTFLKPLGLETPSKLGVFSNNSHFGLGKYGSPSIPHGSLFMSVERGLKSQSGIGENFKFEGMTTPGTHRASPMTATPLKEFNRNSSRVPWNSSFLDHQFDKVSPEKEEQNGFTNRFQNTRPHSTVLADPVTPLSGNHFLSKDSAQQTPYLDASSKQVPSDRSGRPRKVVPEDDQMDISWSHGEKDSVEYTTANGGLRWRSDDTSEDEEQQSPDRLTGAASQATPARKFRRSRFARR
ncbi:E3 ubiquitin-protein ligase HOS1 [Cornus florida]|uniref:E3 ubiquitin-protein ligase HOS1 n=1 Tax=Cornus florida TaxID=4283 RepID=UPI002898F8D9|nr:E3 ubiquitin-protein ligase HOS1 [Cornus florida]